MKRVDVGGITIDRCTSCGAMWFDVGEVERVLKMKYKATADLDKGEAGATAHPSASRPRLRCPRDGEALTPRMYPDQSHIVVDECRFCHGMLLDAGELKDAADFTVAERVKSFFA
jgi:Zn-finger nucleic acid-binding protein